MMILAKFLKDNTPSCQSPPLTKYCFVLSREFFLALDVCRASRFVLCIRSPQQLLASVCGWVSFSLFAMVVECADLVRLVTTT